ncbi:MAG: cytochrome P450 [Burkholderiaceae bacterium]
MSTIPTFATRSTTLALDQINLASLDTFARPDLDGIFETLRRERPVSWHQHPDSGERGFWAVTRYDDIVRVNRDTDTFSNGQGIQVSFEGDGPRGGKGSMIEMDPPRHSRFRRLVAASFLPGAVARLEDRIRARAEAALDAFPARGGFDFVAAYATPIPMTVFYDMMGVPEADQRRVLELADLLFFSADPVFGGRHDRKLEAGLEIQAYGRALARAKRASPGDDLMSALAGAEVDGERLTIDELGAFFALLGAAGADTTRATLAFAMEALSRFADQKRLWLEDLDGRAAAAVEECIRWSTPTMHMRRTATRDTEIAGQAIKAGDKVALWFASGNRDAAKFPEPYRFDIARAPNPHMAFGMGGPHFCLGAHLARLELRIALPALLSRYPGIRATGPARSLRSNFIHGPAELPVILDG